jgi:putative nucleotidyltransferase with HDIG domain
MIADGKNRLKNESLLISEIIDKADQLPAAPGLVSQVLTLTANPDFSMEELVSLVRLDPAITAYVLRMCNSPYFGLRQRVSSLDHALAVLGVNALVDVVLGSGLLQIFGKKEQESQAGYLLAKGQLWRHSVSCALIAQQLAAKAAAINHSILFTAALLHDVGKLVLSQFVSKSFYEIASLVHEHHYPMVEAEREVIGIDHAALGGIIVEKWGLGDDVIGAISCHHHPFTVQEPTAIALAVAVANVFANAVEYGMEIAMENCDFDFKPALNRLRVGKSQDELFKQLIKRIKAAADMLNMMTV